MYFSGLKRHIQGVEEKKFYDVALLYLNALGYKGLSIVDGPNDGGRDVVCENPDIDIQLSVRGDWRVKINYEAGQCLKKGKRYFHYVTNRVIAEGAEQEFLSGGYKLAGEVEVKIHDLNRISTLLSLPQHSDSAYEALGLVVKGKVNATPKEIALSNVLLFSEEGRELRDSIVEGVIKSIIYSGDGLNRSQIERRFIEALPGADSRRQCTRVLQRLASGQSVNVVAGKYSLSRSELDKFRSIERSCNENFSQDRIRLEEKFNLSEEEAEELVKLAFEVLAREDSFGSSQSSANLMTFLAKKRLTKRKKEVIEELSELSIVKMTEFSGAVEQVFSTNSFDVFRALAQHTSIEIVLDASVAMPLMMGMVFSKAGSRYGIGATAIKELSETHGFNLTVPTDYIEEMASHGLKALEKMEMYERLEEESRSVLKASENAYISHYSYVRSVREISFKDFLKYFDITKGASKRRVQNRITTILEDLGLNEVQSPAPNMRYRQDIAREKPPQTPPRLIDHDASVCTYMYSESDKGFIFATWDKVMVEFVKSKARIYADTPSRIADFLSMASGGIDNLDKSYSMYGALMFCDEQKASKLAKRIESVTGEEDTYKLNMKTRQLRDMDLDDNRYAEIMEEFFDASEIESDNSSS